MLEFDLNAYSLTSGVEMWRAFPVIAVVAASW